MIEKGCLASKRLQMEFQMSVTKSLEWNYSQLRKRSNDGKGEKTILLSSLYVKLKRILSSAGTPPFHQRKLNKVKCCEGRVLNKRIYLHLRSVRSTKSFARSTLQSFATKSDEWFVHFWPSNSNKWEKDKHRNEDYVNDQKPNVCVFRTWKCPSFACELRVSKRTTETWKGSFQNDVRTWEVRDEAWGLGELGSYRLGEYLAFKKKCDLQALATQNFKSKTIGWDYVVGPIFERYQWLPPQQWHLSWGQIRWDFEENFKGFLFRIDKVRNQETMAVA